MSWRKTDGCENKTDEKSTLVSGPWCMSCMIWIYN